MDEILKPFASANQAKVKTRHILGYPACRQAPHPVLTHEASSRVFVPENRKITNSLIPDKAVWRQEFLLVPPPAARSISNQNYPPL